MLKKNTIHRWFYMTFWLLFVSYCQTLHAEACDSVMMEARYDTLVKESQLYQSQSDYWKLVDTVESILTFQNFIKHCIDTQQSKITNIDELLEKFKSLQIETPISVELQQKKVLLGKNFVNTLFLNNHLKVLLAKTTAAEKSSNYWNILTKTTTLSDNIHKVSWSYFTINVNTLYQQISMWIVTDMHWLLLISSFVIGFLVRRWYIVAGLGLYKNLQNLFTLLIIIAAVIYNYLLLLELRAGEYMSLKLVEMRYILYFIVLSQLLMLLINRNRASPNEPVIIKGLRRFYIILPLGILGYFMFHLLKEQWSTPALNVLLNTEITLYNLALLWLIWPVFKVSFFNSTMGSRLRRISKALLFLSVSTLISTGWAGYQHAALLFIPNIFITIIMVTIFLDVNRFLKVLYTSLSSTTHQWHIKLCHFLKIDPREKIWELLFLRAILLFIVLSFGIIALQQGWGMILFDTYRYYYNLAQGVVFFNINIYPLRITQAFIAFCFIMLLGRSIGKLIIEQSKLEPTLCILIRKIISSAVCCIAIMIGLIIAGANPLSLTIVSGLFSIGIGWGIKEIVADIICGLYILFARPVEIGDCIKVDGTEGKVCNIGLVSTHIKTFKHYDLFVANSKLIYNTIRNYSFHNNMLYLIKTAVSICDRNQVELARQLLIDIASKNPRISQENPNQPAVFFEDDTLILRCVVINTHQSDQISSDLNLAIARVFTERKISFSFK